MTWSAISRGTVVSRSRLRYFATRNGLEDPLQRVHNLEMACEIISPFLNGNPNCGERTLRGYLLSSGIHIPRRLLRDAVAAVDPGGRERRAQRTRIARADYDAHGPGYLWHMDTYLKISLSAGIIVAGCIDGYTRVYVMFA